MVISPNGSCCGTPLMPTRMKPTYSSRPGNERHKVAIPATSRPGRGAARSANPSATTIKPRTTDAAFAPGFTSAPDAVEGDPWHQRAEDDRGPAGHGQQRILGLRRYGRAVFYPQLPSRRRLGPRRIRLPAGRSHPSSRCRRPAGRRIEPPCPGSHLARIPLGPRRGVRSAPASAGTAAGARLPGGEKLLTPPLDPVEVALLSGRCHLPSLVCGSYDAALTGPGSGSVRSVGNVFSGQALILKSGKAGRRSRTDRLGNYVEHGWGRAVSWDDSGARTGPHEIGLIAKIAARNDDDAARRLYRKYRMELFRFGVHVLHDQGLAEEMVQETFIKFCRQAGQLRRQAEARCGAGCSRSPSRPPTT